MVANKKKIWHPITTPIWNIAKKQNWSVHSAIWTTCLAYINHLLYYQKQKDCIARGCEEYYRQNADRIQANTDMLADKKSKKIYRGLFKYHCTGKSEDFPAHIVTEKRYQFRKLKYTNDEVYLDCGLGPVGSFDAIKEFIQRCPNYRQIIGFEPERANFEAQCEHWKDFPNVTILNNAVYDKVSETPFEYITGQVGSHITEVKLDKTGSVLSNDIEKCTIQTITIDSLNLDKVTHIKMDIEGAELPALKGAENTIRRDRPKLAICIFHSAEDMIDIPEYISSLNLGYDLYVRHYSTRSCETVLYAIPRKKLK